MKSFQGAFMGAGTLSNLVMISGLSNFIPKERHPAMGALANGDREST